MKIDFKKIINIKKKEDLKDFPLDKPLFQNNYLFHYLIQIGNLDGLKLMKIPIHIENTDGLNGIHLAAKEYNFDILCYLIETYPDYIYNRTEDRETFVPFLPIEELSKLIKKYPKLNWEDLIINGVKKENVVLATILQNLKFNDLQEFINTFDIIKKYKTQFLFSIIQNNLLKTDDKIKILDKFTDDEINIKNEIGQGLILVALNNDDEKFFDYLLNRKIDIDYYSFIKTDNPLRMAVSMDILHNINKYTFKIIKKIVAINSTFYKDLNRYADNLAHTIIYARINRNEQIMSVEKFKDINYDLDLEVLKYCDNECWNHVNIEKESPLELLVNLDYNIYSKLVSKISIDPKIVEKLEKANINSKWLKLYKSLDKYTSSNNIVISSYSDCTLFQSKFKDVAIFALYLKNAHSNLFIPNMNSYLLNDLTFEDTFPFVDNIITKEPVFPWTLSYYSENEYYIHPYLNNIINGERHLGQKRFGLVFITLIYDKVLHANILLYDLQNMTVERFEPYGNSNLIESEIDDILEEELTWNTGLKYLRPKDYLPYAGFQTISNENDPANQKPGDFGGFCLAWCLWYLESRILNPEIEPKILVNKLINKLSSFDIKFIEYIRNYANKINQKRVQYMETIGIDKKSISDVYLTNENDIKLTQELVNKFSSKQN